MGGKVLEFDWEKPYYKGRNEGAVNDLVSLVYDNIITLDVAEKRALDLYGTDKNDFEKLLKNFSPDETLKQG